MIIVKLIGGLGNQMFQFAMGYSLSQKWGEEVFFDTTDLVDRSKNSIVKVFREYELGKFGIDTTFLAQRSHLEYFDLSLKKEFRNRFLKLRSLLKRDVHFERTSKYYSLEALRSKRNLYLVGFWQSPMYFAGYEMAIRQLFCAPSDTFQRCSRDSRNMVALSVRRGDYVNNSGQSLLDLEYYVQAVKKIRSILNEDCSIWIFSDDFEYARYIAEKIPGTILPDYSTLYGNDYFRKFRIIEGFDHHIIANSTYSWWSAWLAKNPQKIVIAPKAWNKTNRFGHDINLDSWILI